MIQLDLHLILLFILPAKIKINEACRKTTTTSLQAYFMVQINSGVGGIHVNLFNKGPGLLKRVICVTVSSIFWTALESFWLAAFKLHSALVFQSGSRHDYRGELCRKKTTKKTNTTQLVADSLFGSLYKALWQREDTLLALAMLFAKMHSSRHCQKTLLC